MDQLHNGSVHKQNNKREWLLQVVYGKTCPTLGALLFAWQQNHSVYVCVCVVDNTMFNQTAVDDVLQNHAGDWSKTERDWLVVCRLSPFVKMGTTQASFQSLESFKHKQVHIYIYIWWKIFFLCWPICLEQFASNTPPLWFYLLFQSRPQDAPV